MKYYKIYIAIILQSFSGSFSFAQIRTVTLDYEKITCTYSLENGRLSGNYVSYYNNGNKRAEGRLENSYRTGRWIVWDSTGRKRMERVYKNPFEFKRVFPPIPNEGPIPLLAENSYKLEYNSDGIINYAVIKTEDAVWRHKYWRYLEPGNNEVIFKNNRLLKIIIELIRSKDFTVYNVIDDRFTTPLKKDGEGNFDEYVKYDLAGIKLKEEAIFDMNRLVFEYRILGFCPVVKIDGKLRELFWVYYPDVRKYLGKEYTSVQDMPKIKTLDDLFVFRYFSSLILKTTVDNPYDRFIKDFPGMTQKEIIKEQEALELRIIEAENNIWIGLTK